MNDVTTNPVFVDGTGRRSRRVRRLAYVASSACTVYMVVVGASLAAGQRTPMMELPFGEAPAAAPAEVPSFLQAAPVLGAPRAGGVAARGSSARGVQVVDLAAFVAPATRPATRVAGVAVPLQAAAAPDPTAPAPAAPVVTPPATTPPTPPTAPPTVPPAVPPVTGDPGGSEGESDPVTPPPVTPPPATPDPVVPDPGPVTPPTSTPVEPSTEPEPAPPAVDLTPLGQVVDGLL